VKVTSRGRGAQRGQQQEARSHLRQQWAWGYMGTARPGTPLVSHMCAVFLGREGAACGAGQPCGRQRDCSGAIARGAGVRRLANRGATLHRRSRRSRSGPSTPLIAPIEPHRNRFCGPEPGVRLTRMMRRRGSGLVGESSCGAWQVGCRWSFDTNWIADRRMEEVSLTYLEQRGLGPGSWAGSRQAQVRWWGALAPHGARRWLPNCVFPSPSVIEGPASSNLLKGEQELGQVPSIQCPWRPPASDQVALCFHDDFVLLQSSSDRCELLAGVPASECPLVSPPRVPRCWAHPLLIQIDSNQAQEDI